MKRRIATLFLCFAVAFTMAVPAFAVTAPEPAATVDGSQTYSYFALGDSIGAGCRNLDFLTGGTVTDQQFIDFNAFQDGEKNINPYAVDFSFVNRIARTINALRDTSVNGAYVGLRAKDVCEIMGLEPSDSTDEWSALIKTLAPDLFNAANAQHYRDGLRNADVITVELGLDDLAAFFVNNSDTFKDSVKDALGSVANAPALAAAFTKDLSSVFTNLLRACFHPTTAFTSFKAVLTDIQNMQAAGANVAKVLKAVSGTLGSLYKDATKYYDRLINYINKNKKDGAIVVVGTLPNPFNGLNAAEFGVDDASLKAFRLLTDPFICYMNNYINKHATTTEYSWFKKNVTRNYYVADISSVDMNPDIDLDGNHYLVHPNDAGQQFIADAYIQALRKAFEDAGLVFPDGVVQQFAVAVDQTGKGDVTVTPESQVVDIYDDAVLTFTPAEGYELNKVLVNGEDFTQYVDEDGILKLENIKQDLIVEVVFRCVDDYVKSLVKNAKLSVKAKPVTGAIVATASVKNGNLSTVKNNGYTVSYKFYRATKKNGTYKYMLTSKNAKYINTLVKNGKTYYYKAQMVVKNPEGKVIFTSKLKDCTYGKAKYVVNRNAKK